jgi:hypothetical protein
LNSNHICLLGAPSDGQSTWSWGFHSGRADDPTAAVRRQHVLSRFIIPFLTKRGTNARRTQIISECAPPEQRPALLTITDHLHPSVDRAPHLPDLVLPDVHRATGLCKLTFGADMTAIVRTIFGKPASIFAEILVQLALFCGAGLLVSLLLMIYGVDLSCGLFWSQRGSPIGKIIMDPLNGKSAPILRGTRASILAASTPEDRTTYRRWVRIVLAFYGALVVSGGIALAVLHPSTTSHDPGAQDVLAKASLGQVGR